MMTLLAARQSIEPEKPSGKGKAPPPARSALGRLPTQVPGQARITAGHHPAIPSEIRGWVPGLPMCERLPCATWPVAQDGGHRAVLSARSRVGVRAG
ncbi:hypothetical protein [Deinococcus sp.]|uniref:hypothetical protein n=1 Tax=Deinococcus sp. TaxID=47478 RepID=UPI003CC5907D